MLVAIVDVVVLLLLMATLLNLATTSSCDAPCKLCDINSMVAYFEICQTHIEIQLPHLRIFSFQNYDILSIVP